MNNITSIGPTHNAAAVDNKEHFVLSRHALTHVAVAATSCSEMKLQTETGPATDLSADGN